LEKDMLNTASNEENGEGREGGLSLLQTLEQLEKEAQLLSDEKADLLSIEEKLWSLINEEIEAKRRKNEELRMEVEEQKTKCVELTRVLNASIREDYSMAFG
jgi:predicted RNase H-like nuclease (RuvC/YqgF family)